MSLDGLHRCGPLQRLREWAASHPPGTRLAFGSGTYQAAEQDVNRNDPLGVEFRGRSLKAAVGEEKEMIREAVDIGALHTPFRPGPLPSGRENMFTEPMPVNAENAEQEITRLTWTVLDGSASLTDRQRLAELVEVQHARRIRIDSP